MGTSVRRSWFSWLVPMALLAGGPATAIAQTSTADAPWSGEAL